MKETLVSSIMQLQIITFAVAALVVVLRLLIRYKSKAPFFWDDHFCVLALVSPSIDFTARLRAD
jgi:hypothetical protein